MDEGSRSGCLVSTVSDWGCYNGFIILLFVVVSREKGFLRCCWDDVYSMQMPGYLT